MQSLSKDSLARQKSAFGLHMDFTRYVGPPVSTALVLSLRGMPAQLFSIRIMKLFKQKMAVADAVSYSYFKDSVCFKYNVRQVPLKPDPIHKR
jgi:hypothetical protein